MIEYLNLKEKGKVRIIFFSLAIREREEGGGWNATAHASRVSVPKRAQYSGAGLASCCGPVPHPRGPPPGPAAQLTRDGSSQKGRIPRARL